MKRRMSRGRARGVVVAVAVVALFAGGSAAHGDEAAWTASGSVLISVERGWRNPPYIARCAWLAAEADAQGILGYMLSLPEGLESRPFTLAGVGDPSAPTRVGVVAVSDVVFDVAFYGEEPGACLNPPVASYYGEAGSPTQGMIPRGARSALVTRPTVSRLPGGGSCYVLVPLCVRLDPSLHVSRPSSTEFLFEVDRTEGNA